MVQQSTFPEDGDYRDAANFAQLVGHEILQDYVIEGLGLSADFTTPEVTVGQGVCTISRSSETAVNAGETRLSTNYVLQMPQQTLSLTDNAVNYLFVVMDTSTRDNASIIADTNSTAPTDPYVRIGQVDTSANTTTHENRSPKTTALRVGDSSTVRVDDTGIDLAGQSISDVSSIGGGGSPISLGDDLDIPNISGDLTAADGETIWDESASYIPQNRLQNDTVSISAGTGISSAGSVALGGSVTINVDDSRYVLENGDTMSGGLQIGGDLTASGGEIIWDESATHIPQSRLQNDSISVSTGSGLVGGGTPSLGGSTSLSHADTSSQSNVSASAGGAITDINVDGFGHVTSLGTTNFDSRYVNENGDTMSGGLQIGGDLTATNGEIIWDESTGYIPQNRLQNDTVTISAGTGIASAGSVALGGSVTVSVDDSRYVLENGDTMSGPLTLGGDLTATGGETIWDESSGYVPQGRLQNDSVSISAGTGISSAGTVALGGSVTVSVDDSRYVLENGDTMSGGLQIGGDLTAANGEVVWDESATHIPQGRLENDTVSISAGTGIASAGSASLGGNVTIDVDDSRYVLEGGDTMSGTLNLNGSPAVSLSGQLNLSGNHINLDGGDQYITIHDGNGNYNLKSGVTPSHSITSGQGGTHVELDESGGFKVHVDESTLAGNQFSPDYQFIVNANAVNVSGTTLQEQGNRVATRTWTSSNYLSATGGSLNGGLTLGGDLTAPNGETIWDESAGYIPQNQLQNDTVSVSAGSGLSGGGTPSLGGSTTVSHSDTSTQGNVSAGAGAAVTDVNVDGFGHVTSLGTTDFDSRYVTESGDTMSGALTLGGDLVAPNGEVIWDESNTYIPQSRLQNDSISVSTGSGIIGGGTPSLGGSTSISHADTSTQSNVSAGAGAAVTDVNVDGFGHITSLGTTDFDSRYVAESGDTMSGGLQIGGDLKAPNGEIIWDESAGHIPQAQLQNKTVTLSAGTGIASAGSVSLGGSVTINVNDSRYVLESGDTISGTLGVNGVGGSSSNDNSGGIGAPAVYTNAIEAQSEKGGQSTYITLGSYTNGAVTTSADEFAFVTDGVVQARLNSSSFTYQGSNVLTTANEGSGNGLDADTVDGEHASAFSDAGHTHALGDLSNVTATGEGAGNGFDADTVDGEHASAFANAGHTHALGDLSNVTATGEGAGNGFNADQVDGWDKADIQSWVNNNADVPNSDYADSAGNADTVDGEHASAFADSGHLHDSRYILESGDTMSGALSMGGNGLTDVGTLSLTDSDGASDTWELTESGTNGHFQVVSSGSGGVQMDVEHNGNVRIGGELTENASL